MTLGAGRLKGPLLAQRAGPHPIGDAHGMEGFLCSTSGRPRSACRGPRTTRDVYDARRLERQPQCEGSQTSRDSPRLPNGRLRAGDLESKRPRAKTGSCVCVAGGTSERAALSAAWECPSRTPESTYSGSEVQVGRDVQCPRRALRNSGASSGARKGRPWSVRAEQCGAPGLMQQVVLASMMADERTDSVADTVRNTLRGGHVTVAQLAARCRRDKCEVGQPSSSRRRCSRCTARPCD